MKSKLVRVALIALGAALVASVALGVSYVQSESERESLDSELAQAEAALAAYSSDMSDIEDRLGSAETRLVIEQQAFEAARAEADKAYAVEGLSRGGLVNAILELAEESDVLVTEVDTESGEDAEGLPTGYSTVLVSLRLTGELADISTFVTSLERGRIGVASIDTISVAATEDAHVAILDLSVACPYS